MCPNPEPRTARCCFSSKLCHRHMETGGDQTVDLWYKVVRPMAQRSLLSCRLISQRLCTFAMCFPLRLLPRLDKKKPDSMRAATRDPMRIHIRLMYELVSNSRNISNGNEQLTRQFKRLLHSSTNLKLMKCGYENLSWEQNI